jgi:hypothetical protein
MRVVAAEELQAHGRAEQAASYFVAAERWLRDRLLVAPDHDGHQDWLVSALVGQRKWAEATHLVRLQLAREPERLAARGVAAVLAARSGDRAEAARLLSTYQPWERGEVLLFRARVAAVLGRADEAVTLLGQAVASGVGSWHWTHGTAWHDFESIRTDGRIRRLLNLS